MTETEKELEKQFGIGKAKAGLIVCAVLVVILAISSLLLFMRVNSLENQVNSLSTDKETLQSQLANLQSEHITLNASYVTLTANYTALQSNYTVLQTEYTTIRAQYDSLQSLYDNLQAEYDSYVTAYQSLQDEVNHRFGLKNLEAFITPEDSTVNAFVLSITGGWSNPDDWNEYWDDLKAMYDWVINNIEYRYDGLYPELPYDPSATVDYWDEMWQFPSETLDLGHGDCEDMAILLCSMVRCYNDMEYWTECIGITNSFGHVAVQLPVSEDKLVIFDPAGLYYSSDSWGNIAFNDISTEIANWLDYWKPEMGEDVYVDLVFSDDIYKTFRSTDEYIAWMYGR